MCAVTDAMQGQVMARFTINAGQVVRLFPVRSEPLLGALVALDDVRAPLDELRLYYIYH